MPIHKKYFVNGHLFLYKRVIRSYFRLLYELEQENLVLRKTHSLL